MVTDSAGDNGAVSEDMASGREDECRRSYYGRCTRARRPLAAGPENSSPPMGPPPIQSGNSSRANPRAKSHRIRIKPISDMITTLPSSPQNGFAVWRRRAFSRRSLQQRLVPISSTSSSCTGLARRFSLNAVSTTACPAAPGIRVGEFVVGEKGDHRLLGHPAIRY